MSKVYQYELIGKEIEVVDSRNKSNLGIEGKVIDETKNTLVVFCGGKNKTLMKSNITFKIKGEGLLIEGKALVKRPEERLKTK